MVRPTKEGKHPFNKPIFNFPLESDVYEVEKIVSKKKTPTGTLYEVKWKGYDSSENTWEPANHFAQAKDILKDFEESLKPAAIIKKGRPTKKIAVERKAAKKLTKDSSPRVTIPRKKFVGESGEEEENVEDIPQNIVACLNPKEKDFEKRMLKISWKKRKDGVVPKTSILSAKEIKMKFGTDILFDFYEKNFKI